MPFKDKMLKTITFTKTPPTCTTCIYFTAPSLTPNHIGTMALFLCVHLPYIILLDILCCPSSHFSKNVKLIMDFSDPDIWNCLVVLVNNSVVYKYLFSCIAGFKRQNMLFVNILLFLRHNSNSYCKSYFIWPVSTPPICLLFLLILGSVLTKTLTNNML